MAYRKGAKKATHYVSAIRRADVFTTSPVSLKPSVLKIALIEALPDDRYWQSLHQQARVATGNRSSWNCTAPQKHRPATGFTILNTPPLLAQAM
jgi:hypothetical protein